MQRCDSFDRVGAEVFVGEHRCGAGSLDEGGGDGVDTDAERPPLDRQAADITEAFVATAEDQRLDDSVEQDAVFDAPVMTAQWMPVDAGRE